MMVRRLASRNSYCLSIASRYFAKAGIPIRSFRSWNEGRADGKRLGFWRTWSCARIDGSKLKSVRPFGSIFRGPYGSLRERENFPSHGVFVGDIFDALLNGVVNVAEVKRTMYKSVPI